MTVRTKHEGDCGGTWCDYCGCCEHGDDGRGCRAAEAPIGMGCPGDGCGCEGESYYDRPIPPPDRADADPDDEPERPDGIMPPAMFDLESVDSGRDA